MELKNLLTSKSALSKKRTVYLAKMELLTHEIEKMQELQEEFATAKSQTVREIEELKQNQAVKGFIVVKKRMQDLMKENSYGPIVDERYCNNDDIINGNYTQERLDACTAKYYELKKQDCVKEFILKNYLLQRILINEEELREKLEIAEEKFNCYDQKLSLVTEKIRSKRGDIFEDLHM